MSNTQNFDWTDIEQAAKASAGNWQKFERFVWCRGHKLKDAGKWAIFYTSHRDAGLLARSNEHTINKLLTLFAEGDDPDLVFERHADWAAGHEDGFSVRVFQQDGAITDAFRAVCALLARAATCPVLDEKDYSEREYVATLQNYASEIGRHENLPEGWESKVFSWFRDNGHDRFTENRDDRGGWAPKEKIIEALQECGLMPREVRL